MNPRQFVSTIYLGDRAFKSILIDGWNSRVYVHVDAVSRTRSQSGKWEFYIDEDILEGRIVFTDVDSIAMEPAGYVPNDCIESLTVESVSQYPDSNESEGFLFKLQVFSSQKSEPANASYVKVTISIRAKGIHLEDPARPGVEIKE